MLTSFASWPARDRRRAFAALLIGVAVIAAGLMLLGAPMTANGGAHVLEFELARTPEAVQRIFDGWGATGRDAARVQTLADFVFLVAYGAAIGAGAVMVRTWAAARGWARATRLAAAAAWAGVVAPACDALENAFLLRQLADGPDAVAATVASTAAAMKFVVIIAALSSMAAIVVALLVTNRRPATT